MKKEYLITAALLAAFFFLPVLTLTARAEPDDIPEEEIVSEEQPQQDELPEPIEITFDLPVTNFDVPPPRPFTPSGTGTVVDHATDGDGKEFYTITTPSENVFYLVIDRQRNSQNVYFLNAVTEADLMALAEIPEKPMPEPVPARPAPAAAEPEPTPTLAPASPAQNGGNMGMIVLIVAVVVIGGGAGWYLKVYRPKQQGAVSEDEYEPPAGNYIEDYSDEWEDVQVDSEYDEHWSGGAEEERDEEEE